MPTTSGHRPLPDERGQSVSVFALTVVAAIVMTTGLVVDGGQRVAAASRAEATAAAAARVANNAAATERLAGLGSAAAASRAARTYLAGQPDVSGTVSVADGIVTVSTSATEPTIFLSVIGIDSVRATGSASSNIVASGEDR